MRIFLLADYYNVYLENFYRNNSGMNLSYDKLQELLFRDYYGSFVSYRNYFIKNGHDCWLVIGNDYVQQQKWLDENNIGIRAYQENKHQIVISQLESYKPDIFFMGSMFDYYGSFLGKAKYITKKIFAWISCPYPKNLDLTGFTCIISSNDNFVHTFRRQGLNSEKLMAAFDKDILNYLDDRKNVDISFIGALSGNTHSYRVKSLKKLIKSGMDINVWGYGLKKGMFPWKSPIERVYQGEAWGLGMYRKLNQSRITLNFHIDVVRGWTGNMRLYEATGCGALLITEDTENLKDIYIPDKEVVTFSTINDLKEKIIYYLNNPYKMQAIAKNGQKACIERHGYNLRIIDFENILSKYI